MQWALSPGLAVYALDDDQFEITPIASTSIYELDLSFECVCVCVCV